MKEISKPIFITWIGWEIICIFKVGRYTDGLDVFMSVGGLFRLTSVKVYK